MVNTGWRRRTAGGALLLGALCLGRRTDVAAAATTGTRAVAVVTAFITAWNEGDVDSLLALFTPAAETRVATSPGAPVVIAGVARLRAWLEGLPTFGPRIWNRPVELADRRVRWSAQFSAVTEASNPDPFPTPLLMEAALAVDGRIAVLCIAGSEADLAGAWQPSGGTARPAAWTDRAPAAPHGPPVQAGPGEGNYGPVAAGGLLAAGALLLARRRGRVKAHHGVD